MENRKGPDRRKKCPISRKSYERPGYDALSVLPGRCCDKCNRDYVIPMRIRLLEQQNEEK